MKKVCDDHNLRDVANEFLAQSQNSLDVDVVKLEILEYSADIPKINPARVDFAATSLSRAYKEM